MEHEKSFKERLIYTIGHSNIPVDDFIESLKKHRIELLVDVRSHPYSKYANHFNQRPLMSELKAAKINYHFSGKELGGQPEREEFYDKDGYVLYDRIAASRQFKDGIEFLESEIEKRRVAIMCGEENPRECHRRLLISRVLFEKGIKVFHILKDGNLISEEEIRAEEEKANQNNQLSLFDDREPPEWKSTQSVSPNPF